MVICQTPRQIFSRMWNYAIHTASVHLVLGSESLGTSAAPVDCDHKCQDPRGHSEGYYYVGWGGLLQTGLAL